ncbi:glycoside hydrolase family 3 C-terminal domain-containing protein [Sphingomonas sp. CARO-RG-8B-R24-01]|uniref:glycoside hydrolase family 3 C-terminal domain-containing protein n=1 Tax=Sphingomonas sp. CARO-RG-8B-R24-01 TaxID=2914831 RepID=UPI001F590A6D|nr:glycoside hydrolase family 3 C-terminal domain-containing protein [Sphingomonas sp. CARO-RG-8B-R24-01]
MTFRVAAVPLLLIASAAAGQVAAPPPPATVAPEAGMPTLPAWNKVPLRGTWNTASLSPDARATALVAAMTRDEKQTLVFGYFGTDFPVSRYIAPTAALEGSAGYVPAIPRLGIPAQFQTDAGVGVATQGGAKNKRGRTALPSGLAIAASWDLTVARAGGAMIGDEARRSGFSVMLAGGVNLLREPRNGRNFEYGGEDPLLAGTIVGEEVIGIQSNHVVSTIKHYAFNDQETDRNTGNSIIDHSAARVSDLLAFQLAIERATPGSIMCSYNRVDGTHACENSWLLTDVLRGDWGFKGYVMSDWGATHSTIEAANAGLDQDSGFPFDKAPYFGRALQAALDQGTVAPARLDLMTHRILRAMFAQGLFEHPLQQQAIDLPGHAAVTRAAAEAGTVLLKNDRNLLPLTGRAKRIAIIGGHADKGVLAGGGSSLVYPAEGNAVPGIGPTSWPGPVMYYPSSPMEEIKRQVPGAAVRYIDGSDPVAAAALARDSDVVIVFATQWAGESFDVPMGLDGQQDALIAAVGSANRNTVVVLETGGPVAMPWIDRVGAVVEAWYPGTAGGAAIANVLTGKVNPSGRLPVTFPRGVDQLPDPALPHSGDVRYREGAAVGYKWFDAKAIKPLFAFGHGLSYTRFASGGLKAGVANGAIAASFTVRNTGPRAGASVAQIYVAPVAGGWEAPKRLGGFAKVDLAAGASRTVSVNVDPRLLATWDEAGHQWRIAGGAYRVTLADSAMDVKQTVTVTVPASVLPATWRAR